ncbi:SigE family RNA polymerase sigma factor [Nonomuraea monospora]|uniref:SigE family RNA polymerase sigma factor n=1 Tax=Nonomuraea monospora TaxID=568818 RepID=A0ABN3CSD7_9ACTN
MAEGRGEQEFTRFVQRTRPALRRIAYALSDDWHEADDLVQRTLMTIFLRWPELERRDRMAPYARRVMTRLLISDRRSSRWTREVLFGVPPEAAAAHDPYVPVSQRMMLRDALARLGPRQRATIFLRFWEDRSVEETARVLGNESSTVRSQTVRALNTLRDALDASST